MAKFLKDLNIGNKGQKLFINILEENNEIKNIKLNNDKYFDVSCDYKGSYYTFEIKYDLMASKTGNIAIEFYNPKTCEDSGIATTKADFWITVLNNPQQIYLSPVKFLKNFLDNTKPCRIITVGGDKNSSMYLFKKDRILDVCMFKINSSDDLIKFIEDLNAGN